MLALGATFMVLAESDTWATVGLVLGLLGGGGLGTGLSLLLFPDVAPEMIHDEDRPGYPDPLRTPPTRRYYPDTTVCLRCGQPECTGEPCVNLLN